MSTLIDRLTDTQRQELSQAMAQRGGLKEFSQRHGINFHSLRGGLSRARGQAHEPQPSDLEEQWDRTAALLLAELQNTPEPAEPEIECPPPINIVAEPAPLKLEKFLYASDLHCPLHDDDYVKRLCAVGQQLGVKHVVIGGDAFDFGGVSSHGDDIESVDINQEVDIAGKVLRYIKWHFQTVYILPGNHCRRVARRLDKNLSFRNLVKMALGDLTGVVTTEHDFFLIDTPFSDIGWTVGHPRFFAVYPTKGLDTVALQRQRNVIGAHSHTLGLARIGHYLAVSPGHLMREDLTPYLVRQNGLSKHPDQAPARGFVLVESTKTDGDVVTLFGEGLTRWSDYI